MKVTRKLSVWITVFSMLLMMCSFPSLASDSVIYGSGNTGENCEITSGGEYTIAEGATGTITISTTDPVTLCGRGISSEDVYTDLSVEYTAEGADLTLQDVYIDNETAQSVLKFNGTENVLTIDGTCLIDHNIGAGANAAIHVDNDDELEICGSGTLYLYKCAQGSGIGGDTGQLNGAITFNMENGYLFAKGTKQGAVIGAGANSASEGTPGEVRFVSGTYNLLANARGGCVGGSAGADGASAGTLVTIEKDACVNINVDWTGSAIGGGGYASGNDASGGTLIVNGGSLRCFIDQNAASSWGLTAAGVNDTAITAQKQNGQKESVYCMKFDTTQLSKEADSFTAVIDDQEFYSGGLHQYGYVNEDTEKTGQADITSTPTNWFENGETNLYFYVTGEDHTVKVNGETFLAAWDEETQTFTLQSEKSEESCSVYFDNVTPTEIAKDGTFTADLYLKSDVVPGSAEINLSAKNGSIVSIDCSSDIKEIMATSGKISFFGNTLSAENGLKIATVKVEADGSGNAPELSVTDGLWVPNGGLEDLTLTLEETAVVSAEILKSDQVSCTPYAGSYYLIQYTGEIAEGNKAVYDGQDMTYSEKLKAWILIVKEDVSDKLVNSDVTEVAAEGGAPSVDYSGDVNNNSKVNIIDAQVAYDLAKGDKYTDDSVVTLSMWYRADVNGDGAIKAADARTIQKIIHGITE